MILRSQAHFGAPIERRLRDPHVVGRNDDRVQLIWREGSVPKRAEATVYLQSDAAVFPGNRVELQRAGIIPTALFIAEARKL